MKAKNEGITLIALVITIIVLLILAAISIATITGENGILTKANVAKEEDKKSEYEEALKIIGNSLRPDQIIQNWESKQYLDEFEKEIPKDQRFEGAERNRKNAITLIVITKEGYAYKITENEIKYIGNKGETTPPELESDNITFTYDPSPENKRWTKDDVKVIITTEQEDYTLQYSLDNKNWVTYETEIIMTHNGAVYARLIDDFGSVVCSAEGSVNIIDKIPPTAEVEIETGRSWTTIVVKFSEDPSSEEYISSGVWTNKYFSIDGGKSFHTPTGNSYKYTFEGLKGDTEYEILIKVMDNAGNETLLERKVRTQLGEDIVINGRRRKQGYKLYGDGAAYIRPSMPPTFVHMSSTGTYGSTLYWKLDLERQVKKIHFDFSITDGGSNRGIPGGYVFVTRKQPTYDSSGDASYAASELGRWQWAANGQWKEDHYIYDMNVSAITGTVYVGFQRYWRDVTGSAYIDLNIHNFWYEY